MPRIGAQYNLSLINQNIKKARENHLNALEPISSGRRINHLSDNPSQLTEYFRMQNRLERTEQYRLNINTARTRTTITDAVLDEATDLMNQVYELALQGNDDTLTISEVTNIRNRIDDIETNILDLANTQVGEVYIFGGFNTNAIPFTINGAPPPEVDFNGTSDAVNIRVTETRNVQVSIDGRIFTGGGGNYDVFDMFEDLDIALAARDSALIGTEIANIQTILNQFSSSRSTLGNSMQQLNSAESFLGNLELVDSERLAEISSTDMAKATADLSLAEFALETAFAASRRIMEMSLRSFLS